ncbi:MAG TPA: hypothetical protein VHI13_04820 [Candidatus Kapabacteria bacterium]|nr:hypothetical protein [Candidatus Kapabacteria bacterium]
MRVRLLRHVLVSLPAWIVCITVCHAQPVVPHPDDRPDLYARVQDQNVYLVVGNDTTPRCAVAAGYTFDMLYDSLCRVSYLLSEWRRNGENLNLPKWSLHRRVNADARLLSFNTTTDTFTCAAGDTLSFYREISWANPVTFVRDTDNYASLDTLAFCVELVRVLDSARIAVVDSLGLLAQPVPGRPVFHGSLPLLAVAHYVVPPELAGTRTFMRLLVYHRGTGKYWFTRADEITIGISERIHDSTFVDWINLFDAPVMARTVRSLSDAVHVPANTGHVFVQRVNGTGNEYLITCRLGQSDLQTTVAIYDALGNLIYMPYTSPGASGTITLVHRFPSSGLYYVALCRDGRMTHVETVTIAR